MVDEERPHWTAADVKAVEEKMTGQQRWSRLVETMAADRIRHILDVGDDFRQGANPDASPLAASPVIAQVLPAPMVDRPYEDSASDAKPQTATLYAAMEAYLTSFKGKRSSVRHKARMDQVLNVNLKHVRKDCPLEKIDFLWIDRLCDHFKSRPANQKDGRALASSAERIVS